MKSSPGRYFTQYWTKKTWESVRKDDPAHALAYVAGSQFRERGVQPGDCIYVVTNLNGQMMLAGRMRVARITNLKEARRKLGCEPWDAPDQVFGSEGTITDFDRVVPNDIVRSLRFGPEGAALVFADARLDRQTLRAVRELTPNSARLLDELLEARTPSSLLLVDSEVAVAESLDAFRRGMASHRDLVQSLVSWSTYWVYDPLSGAFGPGKFVGYRNMNFTRYAAARKDKASDASFNGTATKQAIQRAVNRPFTASSELAENLRTWLRPVLGVDLGNVNTRKWRFLQIRDVSVMTLPDEVPDNGLGFEGAVRRITVNDYERDPKARQQCIDHYGTTCVVCGVDLSDIYGDIGRGFVHVHHLKLISKADGPRQVDPVQDLRPVCPNCHAMLHRQEPPIGIDELRAVVKKNKRLDTR
jgi:hypothetical protein